MLPGPGPVGGLAPAPTARSRASQQTGCNAAGEASRSRASQQASSADVESASLAEEPPETPRTQTSSSAEPSLADPESASATDMETQSSTVDPLEDALGEAATAAAEQVLAERWQCELCFEGHSQHETPWQLNDDRCGHIFCRRCVLGCIRWGGRCPYDNAPIPPIVVCGAMGTNEYVYHEKLAEARRTGGIACSRSDCPGVVPVAEGQPARAVACARCGTRHCGRRVCGAPWTAGHRCWDVVEEQRRRAEQELELRLRHPSLGPHGVSTRRRLAAAPRFRPCPQCGVMVEHVGGCNMVYHDSCGTRWCFVCRRVGTCTDFDCRTPGSGPPTPRGPAAGAAGAAPAAPRKASGMAVQLLAMVMLFLSLAIYVLVGMHVGVPRSGFLGSPAAPLDSCQSASCASPSEPASALALEKLDA